jgi:Prealbumin-like fold domain
MTRRSRPAGVLAAAMVLLATTAVTADVDVAAEVPPASATTSVINVSTGGDRDSDTSVAPLAGVRLALYDSEDATDPIAQAWAVCVSDADGDCSFVVPDTDPGGANIGRQFFVRQLPDGVPAGWFTNPELRTGSGSGSNSVARTYQFQTPAMAADTVYSSTTDFMYSHVYSSPVASDGIWQQSRDNPPLGTECGIDAAVVFDLSASVGSNLPVLKQAADGFADALVGTPSRLAAFSFSGTSPSTGTTNHPEFTSVSTQAGAESFKDIYADWGLGAGTNWDQGIYAVAKATQQYELVIVLTDGNPTRFGTRPSGDGSNTHFVDVENGIFSANAVKAKGSRLVALGIGTGVQGLTGLNLRALSGPIPYDTDSPNPAEADYYQTPSFAAAGQALRQLAISRCTGTVSVVKQLVPAENTGEDVTGSTVAGAGWEFTASSEEATVLDGTQTTTDDGTGSVSFDLDFPAGSSSAEVVVEETQQTGHTLVTQDGRNAVCRNLTDNTPVEVTDSGPTGFTVEATAESPISGLVYNRPDLAATVTVDKEWVIDDVRYAEGDQPPGFTSELTLTGPLEPAATAQEWGRPRPGYVAGDSTTIDETVTLADPTCVLGEAAVTDANGAEVDEPLPYPADLPMADNRYTVTNTVVCDARVTLVKQVVNEGYGSAEPDDWTLSASGPTPISGATGDEAITERLVDPGGYTLSESDGPDGYTASDWSCESADGALTVEDGEVDLVRGADVTCVIVNTDTDVPPAPTPSGNGAGGNGASAQVGPLATTGAAVLPALVVFAGLVTTGVALTFAGRRRR